MDKDTEQQLTRRWQIKGKLLASFNAWIERNLAD